jgi:hypothetical protein
LLIIADKGGRDMRKGAARLLIFRGGVVEALNIGAIPSSSAGEKAIK